MWARLPRRTLRWERPETGELWGYLFSQSNITKKNRKRLATLIEETDLPEVRKRAELVLRIAQLHPEAKKRISFLKNQAPELLHELTEVDWYWEEPNDKVEVQEPMEFEPTDKHKLEECQGQLLMFDEIPY